MRLLGIKSSFFPSNIYIHLPLYEIWLMLLDRPTNFSSAQRSEQTNRNIYNIDFSFFRIWLDVCLEISFTVKSLLSFSHCCSSMWLPKNLGMHDFLKEKKEIFLKATIRTMVKVCFVQNFSQKMH